jgi:hypothetical protein
VVPAAFAFSAALLCAAAGCGGRGDADEPAPASTDEWDLGTGRQVGSVVIEGGPAVTFGSFSGTLRLGGSAATAAREDGFAVVIARHGEVLWLRAIGTAGVDQVTAAASMPDPGGAAHADVVVAGFVAGPTELGGVRIGERGQPAGYLARLAADDGRPRWAVPLSATGWVVPRSITVARDGAIAVAGEFGGVLAVGGASLTEVGGDGRFVARVGADGALRALDRAD